MMDPPIKLFGQTIAFTTSASSQDDAVDGAGTTSTGAWEELSSSAQDVQESGAESGAKSELTLSESPASCFPELSSSGSNVDDEKIAASPREVYASVLRCSDAPRGRVEDNEDPDVEDVGLGSGEGTTSQEFSGDDIAGKGSKMPRRPDKAVACPRCHSLETKFCYYNNYNVKQPRHFCKHCQRYWTAGGTLRNVPVGAGRRKNKNGSVISPRQTPEMGLVRGDEPDVAAPLLVAKGVTLPVPMPVPVVQTVLGGSLACSAKPIMSMPAAGGSSDSGGALPYAVRMPSLEATYVLASSEAGKPSDTSALGSNLPRLTTAGFNDGSKDVNGSRGWHSKDESPSGAFSGPCGSTSRHDVKGESGVSPGYHKEGDVTGGWSSGGVGGVRGSHGAPEPFGFFNGGWPYGYNVGWSGGAALCAGGVASAGNGLPPPTPPSVAAWGGVAAGSMWTGIPWPMSDLAWSPAGWPPPWSLGPWAMGAAAAGAAVAMSPSVSPGLPTPIPCPTGIGSSSLGKHARSFEGGQVEGAVWAPKSLRMADPEEAMRSSVWRILGVGSRPDLTTASTFKAFQPKPEGKKIADDEQQTVQATLHANPAAMSRSMYFHESN